MLNELQLMIHLPIFSIYFPANAMMVYAAICQIAQFDVLEGIEAVEEMQNSFFHFDEEEDSYSPQFE